MWRRRSSGGWAARSGRAASRTTSPVRCPAPRRSRPRNSPKALSSMSKMTGTTLTAPLAQIETPLLAVALVAEARNGIAAADVGQVVVEGAAQGAWAFTELKAAPDEPKAEVEAVAIACDAKEVKAVGAGERLGEAIAAGHFLTRYLQMLPGNVCTPAYLADRANQLGDQHGFTCTVLDRAQMRQENMGALLAVAQGSQQEPRFIVLEYRGAGAG